MAALIQPSGRRSRTRQSSTIPSNVTEEPTSFVEEQPDTPTHQGEAPVHAPGGKTARVHFEANGEDHHEGGTYQPQAKLPIGKKQTTMKAAVSVAPTSQDTILKDFKNSSKLQGYAPVWDRYVKMAEEEDEDLVEDWDR
ncbi:hypothetical protein FRC12_013528 [Ceratobasidium sp. 428]|nr:hypothetical protein FRC12_013528 [Ceratobasidium sp. 428]